MAYFGDSDLAYMLSGTGAVTVVFGSYSGPGQQDLFDEVLLKGDQVGLIGKVTSIVVQTSAFPGIKVGSSITINGIAYTVRDRLREGDGATTKLLCEVV